jgi:hypothetical protein
MQGSRKILPREENSVAEPHPVEATPGRKMMRLRLGHDHPYSLDYTL